MIRHAAVAGYFYEGSAEALRRQVAGYVIPVAQKKDALGILSPHAGLIYSGPVAGAVYSSINLPDTFILIGPNHTGIGAPVSIMTKGRWETPLGTVNINEPLARAVLNKSKRIHEDTLAHLREHSLEVQLPFIQYFKDRFTIVPIQMMDVRFDTCIEVGMAVAEAVKESGVRSSESGVEKGESAIRSAQAESPGVLIVASSDMSHYVTAREAREKDFKAIEKLLDLDPEGLYRTIRDEGITMCGFGPAVSMLHACRLLGATRAELIKYSNSGDTSGDYNQVVGYAGVVVLR